MARLPQPKPKLVLVKMLTSQSGPGIHRPARAEVLVPRPEALRMSQAVPPICTLVPRRRHLSEAQAKDLVTVETQRDQAHLELEGQEERIKELEGQVAQLSEMLASRPEPSSAGDEGDVVGQAAVDAEDHVTDTDTPYNREELEGYNKAGLVEIAGDMGLPKSGNKEALIERILEADAKRVAEAAGASSADPEDPEEEPEAGGE